MDSYVSVSFGVTNWDRNQVALKRLNCSWKEWSLEKSVGQAFETKITGCKALKL